VKYEFGVAVTMKDTVHSGRSLLMIVSPIFIAEEASDVLTGSSNF
jgi:hypothetical protein